MVAKLGNMAASTGATRRAVTLAELLAVAGCLGLILAAVAPSLQSTLQLSRKTVCLDRLRALGQASLLYSAADPDNMAIPVHREWNNPLYDDRERPVGAYDWGGKSGVGRTDFAGPPAPMHSAYGTLSGFGPATRPLNPFLYPGGFRNHAPSGFGGSDYNRIGAFQDSQLNLDAFRCPADDGPPEGGHCPDWISRPESSGFDYFGTSYSANLFLISSAGGGPLYSNSPYLRPLTNIVDPSRTLVYEETIGRWAWASRRDLPHCSFIGEGIDPGPTKAIRGWHGKNWTYHRAFADAHAESQAVYVEGTEDSQGYAHHYYNEYVDGLPQYPGGPYLSNDELNEAYSCIIIRGDGWQKDTLPAALLPTGKHWPGGGRASYEYCVQQSERSRGATGGIR